MPFDFEFRFPRDEKDIKNLEEFILSKSFRYPHYEDWVLGTAIPEIRTGYKQAILAFYDGKLVCDVIFQPHKTLPRVIEAKNVRTHPELRRRYVAIFSLRNMEAETAQLGLYDAVMVDTRSNNLPTINMLRISGYREAARCALYEPSVEDVVFWKDLKKAA